MTGHEKYQGKSDHDLLVELAVRTEGLPEKLSAHGGRISKLERDRWWLFTLIGAAWMGIVAYFLEGKG